MLNWVDLGILGIVGLSVLTGLFRGFVKEAIALGVWILAIWIAYNYSQHATSWLASYIHDPTVRTIVGFVLILIAVLIAGGIINALLSSFLKRSGLSGTDRMLGMGFGFVRGVFIVAMIILVINMTSFSQNDYVKHATLYDKFTPLVNWLEEIMPDFIKQAKLLDNATKEKVQKVVPDFK